MATPAQIAAALFGRCDTLSLGVPVAYPEHDEGFSPPSDGKYAEVRLFLNSPAWQGLTSGKIGQGLLQVLIHWPPRVGVIKPAEKAALVEAHFPKGLKLFVTGGRVKVSGEPWTASPITDEDEVLVPVTIPWRAF